MSQENPWMARLMRRYRALVRSADIDGEVDDEMRFHIDMEAADNARQLGLSANDAKRKALVEFGGVARHAEDHRDVRGVRPFADFLQDLRYAMRSLRRSAGFALSSVFILALGVGATTAVYSAVTTVLFDQRDDRLVLMYLRWSPTERLTLSTVDYRAIEAQQHSFADVGAIRWRGSTSLVAAGDPQRVRAGSLTAGVFRALSVVPVQGRNIEPSDEVVGAPRVALVSHALAVSSLGGAAAAVGKSVTIDGLPHTVIGVLPPGVNEVLGGRADVWNALQMPTPTRRGPFGLRVVGKLRDGVTIEEATKDLRAISDQIFPLWAAGFQDRTARLTPVSLRDAVFGDASRMLGGFSIAVALVLLIAVANVAGLMLVRAIGRTREVALRALLGASRARLVRLMMTESLTLAAAGAIAGIALASVGLRALVILTPDMPNIHAAHLDWRAATFGVAVAIVAGLIIGAYPAVMLIGEAPAGSVQGGERTVGAGRGIHAIRGAFVVAQFALALPLLATAGLLLNSFVRLQRVNVGFDTRHILTAHVNLPSGQYASDSAIASYWARALPIVRSVAGVSDASLSSSMPPDDFGSGDNNNFDLIDRPVAVGAPQPNAPWPTVTGDYFETLGIPLVEGRNFTPADTGGPAPVVVVSQSWARRYFPDGTAVGRKLISGGCVECPRTTVIGIVGDTRYDGLQGTADAVYGPTTEGWPRNLNLFVKTRGSPENAIAQVRDALRSVDASVPIDDLASMDARLSASVTRPRNWVMMLGVFAAAALLLAAAGIFGMLSYTVSARKREIGVRMALGATRANVASIFVTRGLAHAGIGAFLGLVGAVVSTRWVASSLYEITPNDPPTLFAVTAALLVVAIVACWLPARRASRIDPVDAIRMD